MKKWILITGNGNVSSGLVFGQLRSSRWAQGGTPPTPFGGPGAWMGRGMMGTGATARHTLAQFPSGTVG